jgi:hypothetical protein
MTSQVRWPNRRIISTFAFFHATDDVTGTLAEPFAGSATCKSNLHTPPFCATQHLSAGSSGLSSVLDLDRLRTVPPYSGASPVRLISIEDQRVLCAVFDKRLHSRMPLVLAPAHLKLEYACDEWSSSRVFTTSARVGRLAT